MKPLTNRLVSYSKTNGNVLSSGNGVASSKLVDSTEIAEAGAKRNFGSRDVRICTKCGNIVGASEPLESGKPKKDKFSVNSQIQVMSTDKFRAELNQIKAKLDKLDNTNDSYLKLIKQCREELKSIIEDDVSVIRHKELQHILLHIEKDDRVEAVKKLFDNAVSRVKKIIEINPELYINSHEIKERVELLFLICKHYERTNLKSIFEIMLKQAGENRNILDMSMLHSIEAPDQKDIAEVLPVFLVIDLFFDGCFDKKTGLFYLIWKVLWRGIKVRPSCIIKLAKPDVDRNAYIWRDRDLKFDFDNTINVQLIWGLFSVLDYWDTTDTILRFYTDAIKERYNVDLRDVDLRDNNSLIKYIAMRMDTNDIEKFLLIHEYNYPLMKHLVEELNQYNMLGNMTPTEKITFFLKTFSVSHHMVDIGSSSLYEYFKEHFFAKVNCSSPFVTMLQKKPLKEASEIDTIMAKTAARMEKMIDEQCIAKKREELASLLKAEQQLPEEQMAALRAKKLSLKVDILSAVSSIDRNVVASLMDPITLDLIKEAVITLDGHTFDRACIERILKENNTCPLTRNKIQLNQLSPNLALQYIIDGLSQEQK